jgi:hypothetical protein
MMFLPLLKLLLLVLVIAAMLLVQVWEALYHG